MSGSNTVATMSLNYISELISSVAGSDPYVVGINTKLVYDYRCDNCNHAFQIIVPFQIEIFTARELVCNKCNKQTALLDLKKYSNSNRRYLQENTDG